MPMRRRPVRRRRRFPVRRRRFRRALIPRRRSQIYNYKFNVELANINVPASTGFTGFAYTFAMTDYAQDTFYQNIYDNYRMMAVKLTFFPQIINVIAATATMVELYTVFDPDSNTAPLATTQLDSYPNLKRRMFNRPRSVYCKPFATYSPTAITGATAGIVSALIPRKTWMNTGSMGINYHAIIGGIAASSSTVVQPQLVRVCGTYYMQFRNVI